MPTTEIEAPEAMALIQAALAQPKTHRVVTAYLDGRTRIHETRSAATAEAHAFGERRKIGRKLIDRDTGKIIQVVSVVVEPLPFDSLR